MKVWSRDFSPNCAISFFSSIFSTPCMCRKIRCDTLGRKFLESKQDLILSEYKDPGFITCFDHFANGDQQYLITGDYDGTVKVWHLLSKYDVQHIYTKYY